MEGQGTREEQVTKFPGVNECPNRIGSDMELTIQKIILHVSEKAN